MAILEILIQDGIEFEMSSEALARMNMVSAIISASGSKKARKMVPERIGSIITESLPYLDLDLKSGDRKREEILAEARKEAEILSSNPNISPLSFLKRE